jgi:hypothetical protein
MREIAEETGLAPAQYAIADGWTAVLAGPRIALMKPIEVPRPADELQEEMRGHLAGEAAPELRDIRIVRSVSDFDPMMPEFVTAYLSHVWAGSA